MTLLQATWNRCMYFGEKMAAVQKLALVRLWMCVVRFSQEIESPVKMKLVFYVCEKGLGCLELSYMFT